MLCALPSYGLMALGDNPTLVTTFKLNDLTSTNMVSS
jgi:hypothetical protein